MAGGGAAALDQRLELEGIRHSGHGQHVEIEYRRLQVRAKSSSLRTLEVRKHPRVGELAPDPHQR
ncbi:hypothetical protein AAIH25_15020 [Arthrobacter crystallopoietes]